MTVIDRRYSVGEGTAVKAPCRVATTANITLAGAQTIDGVAVTETSPPTRVLVKSQTDPVTNGIYDVSTGNWTRARDFDGAFDIVDGTRVFVTSGTANDYVEFVVTTVDPIVVGTTAITFGLGTAGAASAAAVAAAASATASLNAITLLAAQVAADAAAAELAASTVYYINAASYGAVADVQFTLTGAITSGTKALTDPSNPFVLADVGKTVCIGGAGAAGAVHVATITAYVGTGAVTISTNAVTTVSGANIQWGTDSTAGFNAAIAAATDGGDVVVPVGIYMATSINLTSAGPIKFRGTVAGINHVAGKHATVIVPIDKAHALIDATASHGVYIEHLQLGYALSPVEGLAGILCANSSTVLVDQYELRNLFITARWSLAPLYAFGVPGRMWNCRLWNYTGSSFAAMFFRDNNFSITSAYQTIATAPANAQWSCYECEFHNYTGAATTGGAIYLRGIVNFYAEKCLIESSSSVNGGVLAEASGGSNNRGVFLFNIFYSESAFPSKYSYISSVPFFLSAWENSYTFGTAKTGGGGTFTFVALETV